MKREDEAIPGYHTKKKTSLYFLTGLRKTYFLLWIWNDGFGWLREINDGDGVNVDVSLP